MSLAPSDLYVFCVRSNPLHWRVPQKNFQIFADGMLKAGVNLVVIECAYGEEDHVCQIPGAKHIGVRAKTRVWNKENLLNLAIQQTPEAKYIGWFDADIIFRRSDWALASIQALQHYDVIQPWSDAYDLGPNGEHIAAYKSFAYQWFQRQKVIPDNPKFWKHDGGPYIYPHCLPGGSLVVPGGRIVAAAARPFEGDLVVIRTAGGQELACSPNHPVFSGGGWVRADELNVGDNVMRHIRRDGVVGHPDEQHAPTRIEDVVRAFSERPGIRRSSTMLPNDLDNRRANSKVAQVWAYGDLMEKRDSKQLELAGDSEFRDVSAVRPTYFHGRGASDFLLQAFGLALSPDESRRTRGGFAELGSRLFNHSGGYEIADLSPSFRRRGVPPNARELLWAAREAARSQDVSGVIGGHADNPSGLLCGLSGQVEADEIVYVGRRPFSGHLYDLQTERGYIMADGLLTHNSGYAWCITRLAYDWLGGLFELGGMGSGDHHMALGLVGGAHATMPGGTGAAYKQEVYRWQKRAMQHINLNIGCVTGTIEHLFHGKKGDRGYQSRWGMFLKHGFDPHEDLKRNSHGVLEFAGNKPELRHDFDLYLQSRNEDINSL